MPQKCKSVRTRVVKPTGTVSTSMQTSGVSPILKGQAPHFVLDEERLAAWVNFPWRRLRNAAGLAGDLISLAVPSIPKNTTDPTLPIDSEDGPYRPTYVQVATESDEVMEARALTSDMLHALSTYSSGGIPIVDGEYPNELSNLYWFADTNKKLIREKTGRTYLQSWVVVGNTLSESMNFLQKFAAGGATIDVAADGIMRRIASSIAHHTGPDRVEPIIVDWRIRDAADGKSIDDDIKPAFLASWEAGEYDFAYQMLKDFMA